MTFSILQTLRGYCVINVRNYYGDLFDSFFNQNSKEIEPQKHIVGYFTTSFTRN